jgi:hypothetical protein
MDSKALSRIEIKSAAKGQVSAVFSTFNVIDSDGDVTEPGAFTDGAEVVISSYQHTSWGGALPVGKGVIRTTKAEAILDGQFFMNTSSGRDTFEVIKELGPRQQWSYGFDIVDSTPGTFDGKDVQILRKLDVHEVSPVLVGAGVNTRTLEVKGRKTPGGAPLIVPAGRVGVSDYAAAIRPHETGTSRKAWDRKAAEASLPDLPTIADLRSMHAWCDPTGDPEAKSSYRFMHHETPNGDANLRACLIGVGQIIGGKSGLPETDQRAVYNHLAGHLEDADIEAPQLNGESGSKQNARIAVLLADTATEIDAIKATRIARVAKGRDLGAATVLFLEWLSDEQRELKSVLDSPQEDMAREYLRFINSLRNQSE